MANEIDGTACIVKVSDGQVTPAFAEIEGSGDCSVSLASQFADTTAKDNQAWQTQKAVLRGFTVTGTFNLKDTAAAADNQDRLLKAFHDMTTIDCQVHVAPDRYYEAACYVSIDYSGPTTDITKVNFTLQAAGVVTPNGFATP